MAIKLRWKNKWINYISITWDGSDSQCSRSLTFSIPHHPYDSSFGNIGVSLGDLVYLYSDSTLLFVGTVNSRSKSAEVGQASYVANDYMYHLTKSNASYKFKNILAENAVKKICNNMGIKYGSLAKTNVNIGKMYFDSANVYDTIQAIYYRARKVTGKKYFVVMDKNKLTVVEKGKDCGVRLNQGETITAADYTDNFNDMVNRVYIYDDNGKKIGIVKNASNLSKYGVFQDVYNKEQGISPSKGAKALLKGITKTATVEAFGNVKAVSGKSIVIADKATGIYGRFYIVNDSHTFENNTHMMSLELSFSNLMEEGADYTGTASKKDVAKVKLTNSAKCWHTDSASFSTYHSSKNCTYIKGKRTVQSTVAKMKAVKFKRGKNKGKCKYKACSKCWK